MSLSPETLQLASMLDDQDNDVGLNVLAQLLNREDEVEELSRILQEYPDPLVRKRIHTLQNAFVMRRRRRQISAMLKEAVPSDIIGTLISLHLLWFDKDNPADIRRDVEKFMESAAAFPMTSLDDLEIFMRQNRFLPENETTIRPESYCLGTVIFHRLGATSALMALGLALLNDEKKYRAVRVLGQFAIRDERGRVLLGHGSWRQESLPENFPVEYWPVGKLLRYIAVTLLSCAVNSDSYRYVMSITRVLTGNEEKNVFDNFPYPYCAGEEMLGDGKQLF